MTIEEPTPPIPNPEPGPDASIDDIQADIDKTRHELGQTVEALTGKADVKGRAKQKVSESKDRLSEKAIQTRDIVTQKAVAAQSATRDALTDDSGAVKSSMPQAAATITAAAVVIVGVLVWRRRH